MRWLAISAAVFLVGCPRAVGTDAGVDAGVPVDDAGPGVDADTDGGSVDAGMGVDAAPVDAGPPPPTGSDPAPPAEVTRTGSGGFLLQGTVLAASGPIDPGEVLIIGDTITCVAASCAGETGADTATVIQTNGVISPGLIDGHNHLGYDFLPEWVAGTTFDNRHDWPDVTAYEDHIAPFADARSSGARYCPAAKWGELRSIIHGTTTVQGQSPTGACLNRLARNADHHHNLGPDHMRTSIPSVRDITDAQADSFIASFTDATPVTRLAVHMQEGVRDGDTNTASRNFSSEFESFAGRDTRTNRHMGRSLLAQDGMYAGTGLLIHAMQLTPAQLDEAADTEASVIWSPSSNIVLYGETADIEAIMSRDITVGLGPDWTVSGEDEMLSEMRFAHAYAQAESISTITPERLWQMATAGSADAVGLGSQIGRLQVGAVADVAVFGRRAADPYRAVLDSRAQDVRLVFINGEGYYGDLALETAAALNGDCDMIDACGSMKFLCAANTPGAADRADETVDDIRAQLVAILEMYARASDLQELVACE